MKNLSWHSLSLSLSLVLFILPTVVLGANGYSCYIIPPNLGSSSDPGKIENPQEGLSIDYLVYNGMGSSRVRNETLSTYQKLVADNPAFFGVYRPDITLFDNLSKIANVADSSVGPKPLRVFIVIGDKKDAQWLQKEGVQAITFVPSERALEKRAMREVETATNQTYYSIAVDHAFRLGTRMADGTDPPSLSTVTVEHIISDARFAND